MLTIDSFNFARAVICHLFSFLDRTPFTDTFWFCTHLPQDIGLLRSHITTPLVGLLLHQVSTSHTARTREQENQACCLPASLIASLVLTHRIELAYQTFRTSIKVIHLQVLSIRWGLFLSQPRKDSIKSPKNKAFCFLHHPCPIIWVCTILITAANQPRVLQISIKVHPISTTR